MSNKINDIWEENQKEAEAEKLTPQEQLQISLAELLERQKEMCEKFFSVIDGYISAWDKASKVMNEFGNEVNNIKNYIEKCGR